MLELNKRKEEAKVAKEQKVKAIVRTYYVIEGNKVKLKNKKCPRCGSIMAHHLKPNERWSCGKCGYTEFIGASKKR
ncbi:30S ribosomal protein S27ae [Saccharolobus solfataricus]|uniref:Small ribosomal subunit protein eS31 n=2 Tax=Saccharolobus solfataricus TaxID=2287 RepID=RS27A_SACS2|nr:30S ribosomal protein S27ae [Saccharolobus solfataricus]Q97ZY7.1 RecName: Full=Small ribosomal subunit protein eS31; AltName: Full=30S ribosomal protein S27ae [Saccharolobus solfataricus P2]AAK40759.1 SSU ribosomal protein S27AE (rps27AE) [Saccharolobus solfataricus P2]ADK88909.1 30S ribosomal protein S27ae [Saccharolobus solfataricus P2]SAI83969.1 30S ribosomal protein S27 [Saccharolobus solfataricus]